MLFGGGILDDNTTNELIDFAVKAFQYFERDYNMAESYYHFSYGISSRYDGVWLPFNKQNHFGLVLIELYLLTGNIEYRNRVYEIAQSFKKEWEYTVDGRVLWRYWPQAYVTGWTEEENISINYPSKTPTASSYDGHTYGGIETGFIVKFIDTFGESVFTKEDLNSLEKTLDMMFVGNKYAGTIKGNKIPRYTYQPAFDWVQLGNNKLKLSYQKYIFHNRECAPILNVNNYLEHSPLLKLDINSFNENFDVVSTESITITSWSDVLQYVVSESD